MTCRMCDKLEPRGCGKTCCEVDEEVIRDFDDECKFTEDYILKWEEVKRQIGNIRNEEEVVKDEQSNEIL